MNAQKFTVFRFTVKTLMTEYSIREPHNRVFESPTRGHVDFHADNMGVVMISEEMLASLLAELGFIEVTDG